MNTIMPPPIMVPPQVPFFTSTQIINTIGMFNPTQVIQTAYINLYDPSNPPQKYTLPSGTKDDYTIVMPYENETDNVYFEKVIFVRRNKRPGITGYASAYDVSSNKPIAFLDATALTGYRTAAKSLLFAKMLFQNKFHSVPKTIFIYGSSTQAFYHTLLFSSYYPDASIYIIARSLESRRRIYDQLKERVPHVRVTYDEASIDANPDIIITATSSFTPLISSSNLRSALVIIAVGSSSGNSTEIDPQIVVKSDRYIDSHVSVSGKGEYKIPLDMGLIDKMSITELYDVLIAGSTYLFGGRPTPVLFVSKGLIIEDYMFAMKILGIK